MIRYNGKIILGIDLGNYNIKTSQTCFPAAYMELPGDGKQYNNVLKYEKGTYILGGSRVAQRDDKSAVNGEQKLTNSDYLYLSQFAIAMELEANGCPPGDYEIHLSTALPPAYLSNKEMLRNLKQFYRRQMNFQYNGRFYRVNVARVYVCPQGTAAIYANVLTDGMQRMAEKGQIAQSSRPIDILVQEPLSILIDIGGGTVCPVVLEYGVPQPFADENPTRGVIWTYGQIQRDIKAKTSMDISENVINKYLMGEQIRISESGKSIVQEHIERYAKQTLMQLREKGLPFSNAYTILMGGGAKHVRRYWDSLDNFAILDYLSEIRSTARGCEAMAQRILERQGQELESRVS